MGVGSEHTVVCNICNFQQCHYSTDETSMNHETEGADNVTC